MKFNIIAGLIFFVSAIVLSACDYGATTERTKLDFSPEHVKIYKDSRYENVCWAIVAQRKKSIDEVIGAQQTNGIGLSYIPCDVLKPKK